MRYRCKSRVISGSPCDYTCEVDTPFKPRACLFTIVGEDWEEIQSSASSMNSLEIQGEKVNRDE